MAIYFNDNIKTFYLETKNLSYVFKVNEYGYLQALHCGSKIAREDLSELFLKYDRGFSANFYGAKTRADSLDTMPNEFPVYGNGDYRHSAILTVDGKGNRLQNLHYFSHEITADKPPIDGMPSLRGGETLIITLKSVSLQVKLFYSVYDEFDAVTRRTEVKNTSDCDIKVERLSSMSLDLPSMDYDFVSLYGRHFGERNIERTPLRHGFQSVSSDRGSSSHQQNPFLALCEKNAGEFYGQVFAFNYVYGGNFAIEVECDQLDTTRINVGFSTFDFSYKLAVNQILSSPETVLVYSNNGFSQMSHSFHDLYRKHLINSDFAYKKRPIVINNWEATYFDFTSEKLFDLIDSCRGLGIDTFVLDDGWFGKRDDDNSGLGDWYVNTNKLAGGLKPIINRCKANGMSFGLWIEPEMVSKDSDLFKMHPDWCLRTPDLEPSTSRNQLVLDLSRKEVIDYIKGAVSKILSTYDISYVKWDMNRNITDAYSPKLPKDCQQEIYHRYMLGFYDLANFLTKSFPHILFEGCSGGGGRFDPSMLAFFPQYWTSDCSDAAERTKIQYGTSLCYPLSSQVGHVSVSPNHQTGRIAPFASRFAIASKASFGYELDPQKLCDEEKLEIATQTAEYKKNAPLILSGDLYRLKNPFESNSFAFLIVSKNKENGLLTFMRLLAVANPPIERIKLVGLAPEKQYFIKELNLTLSGSVLINVGIPIPWIAGDFQTLTYHITKA